MSIYVASKTVHAPKWRLLRAQGVRIISSWVDESEEGQTASYAELAERCIREIHNCDYVLLYCEPGEVLKGAIIEAGAALALGKHVCCVGTCNSISRVFREHPLWSDHETIQSALAIAGIFLALTKQTKH